MTETRKPFPQVPLNADDSARFPGFFLGRAWALVSLLVVITGCSSFHRDWKAARPLAATAQTMEGAWDGEWRSEENGHHGRLRGLVSPVTNDHWQVRFHATYKLLKFIPLSFGYTVDLSVRETNGVYAFYGEEDLGSMAGGIYHYKGTATTARFESTYRSSYDHGTFQMERPAGETD